MADTVLEIKNLVKKIDGHIILDDLNLNVQEGEVVVILGPSGCGKSTLLRCINGLEEIQSGSISVQGKEISGGQKQRVAIVRALILHPEILLFDEVTAALDPEMVREVLDVILVLAKQGKTMLIVTHEMQFAKAVADRIVFIDKGKIAEEGTAKEFFENPRTERAKKFMHVFSFVDVR